MSLKYAAVFERVAKFSVRFERCLASDFWIGLFGHNREANTSRVKFRLACIPAKGELPILAAVERAFSSLVRLCVSSAYRGFEVRTTSCNRSEKLMT